ncbi:MAG: hypothetical protein KGN76_18505 [Acidobacteriota bacterium]|nr:hypothetical protein [Acidobacteriota bacterium]
MDYFELATHHGATRAYDLVILPAASRQYTPPGRALTACIGIALLLIFLAPAAEITSSRLRLVYRTAVIPVAIFYLLVFLSPLVSPYKVLLSGLGYTEGVLVLVFSRLWLVSAAVVQWWNKQRRPAWAMPALVSLLMLMPYGRLVYHDLYTRYAGNFSGFLQLSSSRYDADPTVNGRNDIRHTLRFTKGGYDAQFMYLEAYDPFLRQFSNQPSVYDRFIDAAPYRYGRIGFTLLTKVVSADRWRLYPSVMMALVLAGLGLSGFVLASFSQFNDASPLWGLLIAIVPGFWQSIQVSLPEPIAAAFLLGGYLCWRQRRYAWAGFWLAASLLVRETGTVLVLALAIATLFTEGRREGLRLALIALLPVALWRLYVGWVLWPTWGVHAFFFDSNDLATPLAGIRVLWTTVYHHSYYSGVASFARAATWYPLVLIAGSLLAMWSAIIAPGALTFAAVVYGLVAVSLNYQAVWVYIGNAERTTFELFVLLALVTVAIKGHSRAFRRAAMVFWAVTAAYLLFAGADALHIRHTVLSPLF